MARAAAPVGAVFAAVCLLTGSLWGRPMWGTYWVWDARLTSMLLLFFLYLGHIALSRAYDDPSAATAPPPSWRWSASINLPVIKFSVDWWNTLHQPASVMKLGGPSIHPAILTPLLVMALRCCCCSSCWCCCAPRPRSTAAASSRRARPREPHALHRRRLRRGAAGLRRLVIASLLARRRPSVSSVARAGTIDDVPSASDCGCWWLARRAGCRGERWC
jgi:hypothetical protein